MEKDVFIPAFRANKLQAVVLCPFCGNLHYHGFGDGHRIPHCRDGIGSSKLRTYEHDYYLITLKDKPPKILLNKLSRSKQRLEKLELKKRNEVLRSSFSDHMGNVKLFNQYWLKFGEKVNKGDTKLWKL